LSQFSPVETFETNQSNLQRISIKGFSMNCRLLTPNPSAIASEYHERHCFLKQSEAFILFRFALTELQYTTSITATNPVDLAYKIVSRFNFCQKLATSFSQPYAQLQDQ
jgi:hypothetical protein